MTIYAKVEVAPKINVNPDYIGSYLQSSMSLYLIYTQFMQVEVCIVQKKHENSHIF